MGLEGSSFARTILGNLPDLEVPQARAEMVQAAQRLVEAQADVGAILLECTNMVPYAPDIAAATGRPVHSIHSYLNWFHAGLLPPRFA